MNVESPSYPAIVNILAFIGVVASGITAVWAVLKLKNLLLPKIPEQNPEENAQPCAVEHSTDWSHDEAMHLRRFLDTPTGKTFLARARKIEARTAVIGAHDLMHSAHSAGVTVGFGDCLNWIESLASDKMISESTPVEVEQQTADADKDGSEPVEPRRHF